jgi:hypothetical protein
VGGKRHDLSRFSSGKGIQYPLFGRFGGPLGRSGRGQKILPLPGLDPQTLQPVAIRCTDHAIRAQAVIMNIFALRNVWSCNLFDIDVWFERTYCLHFQCGRGTWCSSLNLMGVLCYKITVKLDQNTRVSVTKDISLGEIYSSFMSDLTCEACGPFIVSYWCVVDLVCAI